MIYGYARVSSAGQAQDGNSLEVQERELKEKGAEVVLKDVFTGTKEHRPELDRILKDIKSGDTLIVTKLDRISRSVTQGINLIDGLLEKGVEVNILNMGVMNNTPTGILIRQVMLAFAEFERNMIVMRTQEGKAVARATNPKYREGRKPIEVGEKFRELIERQKRGEVSVKDACKILNISRKTWYNKLHEI